MRSSKLFAFFALLTALFFLAQFAAELSFRFAPISGLGREKAGSGLKGLSLSSRLLTDAAFAMLEAGSESEDSDKAVRASMTLLRRSLKRNPLDYQARYYLSKAYLRFSAVDNDHFELGVRELRRAAAIRGSNKFIAVDCARVFFSLWPLLEQEDREFAADLLAGVMPALSWPEFSPLVDMWALYVQDAPLLMRLLQMKPDFFGPAAEQLVAAGIPLPKRWEMLALHEAHALDSLERRYNEFGLQGGIGADDARALLSRARAIQGYHRLHNGASFDEKKLVKLRRALLIDVISGMIADAGDVPGQAARLRELIEYYIAEHSGLNELDELQKLLLERGYFRENDFPSLRLKTTIAFRKADHGGVIAEIEALRHGISFVRKEQADDYTAILLLLIDSYYSTKLMTAAEAVAGELLREQPDNPDILWRVLRIQGVLGVEGVQDMELQARLAAVRDSRFLTVGRAGIPFHAYLFNQPEIEIALDPALRSGLKAGQLVQVFADGKIAHESYAGDLPEKIVVGPPLARIESKIRVEVLVK